MIHVLVVDDHQLILDGLASFIAAEPNMQVVGQAKNGREALRSLRDHSPDLVLMDIDMPVMNGLIATQHIKEKHPEIKVVMLSLHLDKSLIQKCLDVGADGYLYKDASAEEVVFAMRTVMIGKPYVSGDAGMALAGKRIGSYRAFSVSSQASQISQLTKREREVLTLVAEGFSSTEIGEHLHISPRTVESHRSNIMHKLDIEGLAGLIKFAVQNGMV